MKFIVKLLFLTPFIWVDATAQDNINPASKTYQIAVNKKLNITNENDNRIIEVVDGSLAVFSYVFKHAETAEIADDELIETIRFEINPNWTNFIFRKKLQMANPVYTQQCYCTGRGHHIPKSGYIKGVKNKNGTYTIEGTLVIEFENKVQKSITFKGNFSVAN